MIIELDGPPRGKGRPRFGRRGNHVATYTDAKTNNYEAALRIAAQMKMAGRPPLVGPAEVLVVAVFGVPKSWSKRKQADALAGIIRPTVKPDVDNILKTVDALNGVVWIDDAQIVATSVRKIYGAKPTLLLAVRPILGGIGEAA